MQLEVVFACVCCLLSSQVEEQRQLMTQLLLQRRGKILLETAIEEDRNNLT